MKRMGLHDVRAWVDGRVLREGRAERVRYAANVYELWRE